MIKILGVDYGDARTGLAVTDALGFMASGAGVIYEKSFKGALDAVAKAAKERRVSLIIVGDPINMDGSAGARSEKCRAFAAELEKLTGIPVKTADERLTTVSALNLLKDQGAHGARRKRAVDELSATLILQSYLDAHREELENFNKQG